MNYLDQQVQKLHQLTVYGRWLFVLCCWLIIGSLSIWGLRQEISLLLTYFTWSGLRYTIIYDRLPSLGLCFCIGITTSVLVWQCSNIWRGKISTAERIRLEKWVREINNYSPNHPLRRWIFK